MLPEEVLKKTRPERFKNEMRPLMADWEYATMRITTWIAVGYAQGRAHIRPVFFVSALVIFHGLSYLAQRRLAKMRVRRKEKDMI